MTKVLLYKQRQRIFINGDEDADRGRGSPESEAVGKERYTEHQRGWENSQENKSGGRMHGRVYS